MLILALETSSQAGSAALLDCHLAGEGGCDNVLSQQVLAADRRSAQSLAPAIAQVLAEAGKRPADVGLVAVTIGPGSFTGLRVGVTTAKSFAYATSCECLGVDTLEVMAQQARLPSGFVGELHAVLDAQRKEIFLARFLVERGGLRRLEENRIVPADQWLQELASGTLVTGTGINRLVDRLPAGVVIADAPLREPQAVTVGQLAWRNYQLGRSDDLWKLAPKYLRQSAAEEKASGRR